MPGDAPSATPVFDALRDALRDDVPVVLATVTAGPNLGAKLLVHYTIDSYGLVKDVWILTPDEAARKPWPTTPLEAQTWNFDWQSQTWTKP